MTSEPSALLGAVAPPGLLPEAFYLLLDALSLLTLAGILAWSAYHAPIIVAGLLAPRGSGDDPGNGLPRVTVIVPSKDEGRRVERCLNAILSSDYPLEKLEVIVVDASSDGYVEEIVRRAGERYPGAVRLIREEEPRGKPAALNRALREATGEVVAVFDADSVPERDAIRRAVKHLEEPGVAAVQGKTLVLNERESVLARVASKEEKAWFHALIRGRERLGLFVPLTGSCQFVKRSALEEVGGWREDALAEDLELSMDLLARGYRVKYANDVVSWQEAPTSLRSLAVQRNRWYRGYMEAFARHLRLALAGRRGLDAAILSAGPYLMALSLLAVAAWLASTALPHVNHFSTPAALVAALNAVSLFSVSVALALSERPVSAKNLAWVPVIYAYWFTLSAVALHALAEIILRRPRVWRRTPKPI
ncbi:glycosyltransferase family 2 protein [Thermofilum pendens]|uniref:Glycosyl transferase, family 2 n=1 Tax=Thermofilum pendens (strain DSM 2475 / Hrk 5) TaxID=368408 RepID=A1S0Z5_THEPD|nr:glycosyltransferase family 2 protein [Thermofilum pendens]ABL79125.1 glycosyl transferase, family 2 [Thermofilum pendens Hrk 5]